MELCCSQAATASTKTSFPANTSLSVRNQRNFIAQNGDYQLRTYSNSAQKVPCSMVSDT